LLNICYISTAVYSLHIYPRYLCWGGNETGHSNTVGLTLGAYIHVEPNSVVNVTAY